jgi:chemotaxis protein CheZ
MSAVCRHDDLLRLIDDAVAAHECGDANRIAGAVEALVEWRSRPLHTVLSRVAHELADSLSSIALLARHDPHLATELPDARSRLGYVVEMTERAAHRTLDCVENCRRRVDGLLAFTLPADCAPVIASIRSDLSEMALAQEYQDLSGQIIRRVIGIVQRVESALAELGEQLGERPPEDGELAGPAVPSVDTAAVSQIDADALLAGLGL